MLSSFGEGNHRTSSDEILFKFLNTRLPQSIAAFDAEYFLEMKFMLVEAYQRDTTVYTFSLCGKDLRLWICVLSVFTN